MEKNMCVCVCVCVNHFAVHQKLTQHCKSTVLEFLKKSLDRDFVWPHPRKDFTGKKGATNKRHHSLGSIPYWQIPSNETTGLSNLKALSWTTPFLYTESSSRLMLPEDPCEQEAIFQSTYLKTNAGPEIAAIAETFLSSTSLWCGSLFPLNAHCYN